jgi:hypothetical protein
MAAQAEKQDRLEADEEEVHKCDSVPPPPGEEGYGKPTEVREMPANLLELLKKGEKGAVDAELADVADLAALIVSTRVVPIESGPPVSGIVPKGGEDETPVVAPRPPRMPRPEIPPPAIASQSLRRALDYALSNPLLVGVAFGVLLASLVFLLALALR